MPLDSKKRHISGLKDYDVLVNYIYEVSDRCESQKRRPHDAWTELSYRVLEFLDFRTLDQRLEEPKKKNKKSITSQQKVNGLLFITSFFYSVKEREGALGDLEEDYNRNCVKFGKKRALKILQADVFYSVYPIVKGIVIKFFLGILKFTGILQIYRLFWG